MNPEGINVFNIGKFVILQMSEEAYKELTQAIEQDGVIDFGSLDENEVKVVATFDGIGQGQIV